MKVISTLAITATSFLAAHVCSADQVRLIVKERATVSASAQKSGAAGSLRGYRSIGFNPGVMTVEGKIAQLKNSGRYETVERDIIVKPAGKKISDARFLAADVDTLGMYHAFMSYDGPTPNDAGFDQQWYFLPQSEHLSGGASILSALDAYTPIRRPRIGIVDGSFRSTVDGVHADIAYASGRDFVTWGVIPQGEEYGEAARSMADCGSHGLGVAAIAGGTTNNGIGIAGIVDAEIVAARALDCESGLGVDIVSAIVWLAGGDAQYVINDDFQNPLVHPRIDRKVDVINLSLAGEDGYEGGCPAYVQDAINFAVSQGVIVVAATGNDSRDAAAYSPANCDNVIAVSASDMLGRKTDFTNFNEQITDVFAPGDYIYAPSYGAEGEGYAYWAGTSQAAPIASALVGMAKAIEPTLSHAEIEPLLSQAKRAFDYPTDCARASNSSRWECATSHGLLDGASFIASINAYLASDVNYIRHALGGLGDCTGNLYAEHFGQSLRLCQMVEIAFEKDSAPTSGATYKLYSIEGEAPFAIQHARLQGQYDKQLIKLSNLDLAAGAYGYTKCASGSCGPLTRMNTSAMSAPAKCLE